MKCQLMVNLVYSGIRLEDFLSNLEKAKEHMKHCRDCQKEQIVEDCLKKKIPDLYKIGE